MTRIFTEEQEVKYLDTRLYGKNATPEQVKAIYRYDGFLPSEVRAILVRNGSFYGVLQENPREQFYLQDATIHIPQFSGTGRELRYRRMMERNKELRGDVEIKAFWPEDDYRNTENNYRNMAYDCSVGLFVPEAKHEGRRVFSGTDIRDIRTITLGSTNAFAKMPLLNRGTSEYLRSQIIDINGEKVLNLGYVYADQAGRLLEKILSEYHALAVNSGKPIELNLFMLGRVGGLGDGMRRHDLVFPTGILDETDLSENRLFLNPVHNILSEGKKNTGHNLNVQNVLDETVEQLVRAKEQGCVCIDMELSESTKAINLARIRYEGLKINFGVVGYVSDLPLQGDTLADELDSDKGEQEAAETIIEKIKERK